MLAPPTERMKADFFIELDRIRRPAREDKFEPWVAVGDSECTEILLKKYEERVIVAVTDFRKLAEIYRAANMPRQRRKLVSEFRKFLERPSMAIEDIDVPGATFAKEVKEIQRSARRLLTQLESIDIEAIASDANLVSTLNKIHKLLGKRLEAGLLVGVRDAAEEEYSD